MICTYNQFQNIFEINPEDVAKLFAETFKIKPISFKQSDDWTIPNTESINMIILRRLYEEEQILDHSSHVVIWFELYMETPRQFGIQYTNSIFKEDHSLNFKFETVEIPPEKYTEITYYKFDVSPARLKDLLKLKSFM